MDVSSWRLALVQHRHLPARGLLSLISLLRAFPLNVIKRNQALSLCGDDGSAVPARWPSSGVHLFSLPRLVRVGVGLAPCVALARAALERSDFAVRRLPLIFALK